MFLTKWKFQLMAQFNPVKNQSVVNQIEHKIVNIRISPADKNIVRYKEAALALIRTQRLITDNHTALDKRLCSIMTETLQHLVPYMTVRTYEEINTLLKSRKE